MPFLCWFQPNLTIFIQIFGANGSFSAARWPKPIGIMLKLCRFRRKKNIRQLEMNTFHPLVAVVLQKVHIDLHWNIVAIRICIELNIVSKLGSLGIGSNVFNINKLFTYAGFFCPLFLKCIHYFVNGKIILKCFSDNDRNPYIKVKQNMCVRRF